MFITQKNEFYYKDGSINTEKAILAGKTARNDAIIEMFNHITKVIRSNLARAEARQV